MASPSLLSASSQDEPPRLRFQHDSALAQWFRSRTTDGRRDTRKTMIIALARKLLIALWRYVTTGELPQGVVLKAA